MPEKFDTKSPIYTQLIERIKNAIANGQYNAGEKMPSVRDLAVYYGVNPNTLQRALSKLEDMGLLYTERTAGRYVTSDTSLIESLKQELPNKIIQKFVNDMVHIGIQEKDIPKRLDQFLNLRKDNT